MVSTWACCQCLPGLGALATQENTSPSLSTPFSIAYLYTSLSLPPPQVPAPLQSTTFCTERDAEGHTPCTRTRVNITLHTCAMLYCSPPRPAHIGNVRTTPPPYARVLRVYTHSHVCYGLYEVQVPPCGCLICKGSCLVGPLS